jgi:hypothetical protein
MIVKTLDRFVLVRDGMGFLSELGMRNIIRSLTKPVAVSPALYCDNIEDSAFFDDLESSVYFHRWGSPRPVSITFKF